MADNAKAVETMIKNIEAKTGKTIAQLGAVVAKSGLTKHGEIRTMLMEKFDLGHGQANTVAHLALKSDGESAAAARGLSAGDVLAEIYSGKKADLRPIHDKVLGILKGLGDYEAAPKKGYVSYRKKKQFVMVGPKTNTAVELGFGAKNLPAHPRLKEMPPNSMCKYTTRVNSAGEVDAQVAKWIEISYANAG
ncbi:MAG: DUF4287 domain-containing protein [Gemmatimonadales bacterium]